MHFFQINYTIESLRTERCPSGLRSTLGKRVCWRRYRGFESHPLRLTLILILTMRNKAKNNVWSGSPAIGTCEPCQDRKVAALNNNPYVFGISRASLFNSLQKRKKKQTFPLFLLLSAGCVASWAAGATRLSN